MCKAIEDMKTDARNEGILEGQDNERFSSIKNVKNNLGVSTERAMEILGIPAEEQKKYISMI